MKFVVRGGKKLQGDITVSGAKNAATPIIAATLLTDQVCVLNNVPRIADVEAVLSILRSIGSSAEWTAENQLTIHNNAVTPETLDRALIKKIRSSILFCGPFLARFKGIDMSEPGGCNIGNRPLDTHFHGLQKLGAHITAKDGAYHIAREELRGAEVILLEASVTATENVLMAASLATGQTIIKNAACEPHVVDLANFLQAMGAQISGEGTPTITIHGVASLYGAEHTLIPDTIEAGTFIILGVASNSEITVRRMNPAHMDVVLERLRVMGAQLEVGADYVAVKPSTKLIATKLDTRAYPGIPTDLQSLFGVLATQAHGLSLIHDTMFEGRMSYIQELARMGAQAVVCDPHRVVIQGPTRLTGCSVKSFDLRAGATMFVAGLIAQGETVINEAEIVDRGYERIEERLRGIGADIERVI